MASTAETAIKKAMAGLLFMSEFDAPFELVSLDMPPSPEVLRRLGGHSPDAPIADSSLDLMFGTQDMSDARMQNLRAVLEKMLSSISIYRVGDVNVTYYVVGKAEKKWLGIRAKAGRS